MAAEDITQVVHRCCDDENHKPISPEHVAEILPIIKEMGAIMIKRNVCCMYFDSISYK